MSDRYCIASGNFSDTAIWSTTDGGTGGASVPTVADDQIYNKSVAVTGIPSGSSGSIVVGPNADVSFAFATATLPTFSSGKRIAVEGRLSFASVGGNVIVLPGAAVDVAEGGRLDIGNNNVTFYSSYPVLNAYATLDNRGEIVGNGALQFYAATTCDVAHRVGRAPNILIVSYSSPAGDPSLFVRFRDLFDVNSLFVQPRSDAGSPSFVLDFGASRIRIGTLTFNWTHSDLGRSVTIIHDGPLELWGDLRKTGLTTPTTVDWQRGVHASLAFTGTYDRSINMPASVTGQTWTVAKADSRGTKAGTLDLTNFVGNLNGKSGESGYAKTLIVRGPSVVTAAADLEFDELHVYGRLVIPSGKTVRVEKYTAEVGASIDGAGTLLFKAGTGYGIEKDTGLVSCRKERYGLLQHFIKAREQ